MLVSVITSSPLNEFTREGVLTSFNAKIILNSCLFCLLLRHDKQNIQDTETCRRPVKDIADGRCEQLQQLPCGRIKAVGAWCCCGIRWVALVGHRPRYRLVATDAGKNRRSDAMVENQKFIRPKVVGVRYCIGLRDMLCHAPTQSIAPNFWLSIGK